jgi:hypothetical protein
MAKYKAYNFDQLVMIPNSLEDQLEPGTLEYTINELVEKNIDLSGDQPQGFAQSDLVRLFQGDDQFATNRTGMWRKHPLHGAQLRLSSGSQHHCPFCVFDAEGD